MKQKHHRMNVSDARNMTIWMSVIAVVMVTSAVLYVPMNIQSFLFWVWLFFGVFAIAAVLTLFGWVEETSTHLLCVTRSQRYATSS